MARLSRATYALIASLLPATATVIGITVLAQIPSWLEMTGVALVVAAMAVHREPGECEAADVPPRRDSRSPPQRPPTSEPTTQELGSCGAVLHSPPPPCHGQSVDDAILEVSDAGRFDRPHLLELEVGADAVEEPRAAAEDKRDDVQVELVDEPPPGTG